MKYWLKKKKNRYVRQKKLRFNKVKWKNEMKANVVKMTSWKVYFFFQCQKDAILFYTKKADEKKEKKIFNALGENYVMCSSKKKKIMSLIKNFDFNQISKKDFFNMETRMEIEIFHLGYVCVCKMSCPPYEATLQ